MLEALEERTLLSASGMDPLVPAPLMAMGQYAAQESRNYLAHYASTLAAARGMVANLELQAFLTAAHMESSVQQTVEQFLQEALFPNTTEASSSKQASPTASSSKQASPTPPEKARSQTSDQAILPPVQVPETTASIGVAVSNGNAMPAGGPGQPNGFSPSQISQAYGFNQITFDNGTIKGDGSGQTIAIVDAYNQPNIASDLQTFDSMYGIAAPPSFTVVNQTGGSTLPAQDTGWALEESLDVEWAHAMAPGANILLVEANTNNYSDLITAVNYARNQPGVSVVSTSWGGTEWSTESGYNSSFTTPAGHQGVTFVASSGDQGSAGAPEFPSVLPTVVAIGGSLLTTDTAGDYQSETAWPGSGGGISAYQSQPTYQNGVVTQSSTMRTVPDVAYNSGATTGASTYAVYDTSGYGGWITAYGTSAGAPQWAAMVAIADQGRVLEGASTLDGATQTLPAIYQMPQSNFHDITTGSNGAYSAGPGYDLVTGRGTPIANLVVDSLVSYDASYWTQVNLSSYFNRLGIADKAFTGGGLDGNGHALSVAANIGWQNTLIPLGPENANDVISTAGQTVTLPAGSDSSLTILAEAVNGNQTSVPFTVNYTNGSSQTFDQSLTNWFSSPSYPYEQRAEQMGYYTNANGIQSAGPTYMSAFVLPLNPTLQVQSITLPNNANVEVLGMALYHNAASPQTVNLSSYFNRLGIADKAFTGGGLDGNGHALSVAANIPWQGTLIPLGPENANDVISTAGQTVTLPTGNYSSLTILAEAVNGNQTSVPFTVNYTNGATQTFDQSLTDWFTFPGYPYEQRAVQMGYYTNADGTQSAGPSYMSAFVLPLNLTNQVQSITLPNDANVEILGMELQ